MQDDPLLFDYNVEQRVKDFIEAATTQVISFHPRILSLEWQFPCSD